MILYIRSQKISNGIFVLQHIVVFKDVFKFIICPRIVNKVLYVNENIKIGSNSYEKVKTFKYLGSLLTIENSIQEEIKSRLKAGKMNLLFYLYFPPLSHLIYVCFCPVGLLLL